MKSHRCRYESGLCVTCRQLDPATYPEPTLFRVVVRNLVDGIEVGRATYLTIGSSAPEGVGRITKLTARVVRVVPIATGFAKIHEGE